MLDRKEEAIQIINSQLKNKIGIEDIEHYNSSFVTENLRNSEADVVYKLKGREVFFLIEHQTYIDYSMPYRMLKYEIEIMESCLINRKEKWERNKKNKSYRYPLIIPIVVYTGHEEWKPELDIRKIQIHFDRYKGLELSRYNVYNINEISKEELINRKTIMNKIFLIERSRSKEELEENLNKILENELTEEEKKFLSKTIEAVGMETLGEENAKILIEKIWKGGEKKMLAVIDMLKREQKEEIEKGIKEGMEKVMQETLEKGKKQGIKEGKKEGIQEGRKEGRREGRKEGIQEGKIEDIRNMIKENLSIEQICRISGMRKEEIEKIKA